MCALQEFLEIMNRAPAECCVRQYVSTYILTYTVDSLFPRLRLSQSDKCAIAKNPIPKTGLCTCGFEGEER